MHGKRPCDDVRLLAPGEYFGQRVLDVSFSTGRLVWTHYRQPRLIPEHAHRLVQISLLVGGSLRERFGKRIREREVGEMVLCPAQKERSVEVVESDSEFINLEFESDEHAFEGLPQDICNRWPERTQALIRPLRTEVELDDSVTPLAIQALAWECLGLFTSPPPQRRRKLPSGVAAARELLEARFRIPPSLSQIVAEVGGDPSNLARSFHKWIGSPIGAYVRTLRLSEARRLLKRDAHLSIGHIADACGYADQAHMTRAFTQSYGMTPRRFRLENV